jgi:hypothetical protein
MSQAKIGELIHLNEPKIVFGYDQPMVDPRDGITLFGPFSRDKIEGQINIGVIGPEISRQRLIAYLKRIHEPLFGVEPDIARPYFPGLEAAFNIFVNFNNIKEIDVPDHNVDKYIHYTDGHQRVYNLVNLYADRLLKYQREEEMPVPVWFVIIPEVVYLHGRPKSKAAPSKSNVRIGLKKEDRSPKLTFLFDDLNKLKEAYLYEVHFHNQLKAKLLSEKMVTQIVRESKIAYRELWKSELQIKAEERFDTAKAWNISTSLYYKSGGLPWVLADARERVSYLGLVFKKVDTEETNRNACCAAQMFLNSGDGLIFRGNIGPWYNPETKQFHLSKDDAFQLISKALETFKQKDHKHQYPEEVFIHARTYFDDDEWKGFSEAAEGKSRIIGIRITDRSGVKLYRDLSFPIPRGSALIQDDERAFLWTRGYIPRVRTVLGLETPNPLSIEITQGTGDIRGVCQDIMSLTKLNYNSCLIADGLPVTLRFANSIGEILTAGPKTENEILPFKHYI